MKGKYFLTLVMCSSMLATILTISFENVFANSVVKKTEIDGEEYLCRPSEINTRCTLQTDVGFGITIAGSSADSIECLDQLTESEVSKCFIQSRLTAYAMALDIQIASKSCWKYFVSKCSEIYRCSNQSIGEKCGHLGSFLDKLKRMGLEGVFTEEDGIAKCLELVPEYRR